MPKLRSSSGDAVHLGILALAIAAVVIGAEIGTTAAVFLGCGVLVLTLAALLIVHLRARGDLAFFLLVPTIISAFQNVYLSPFAEQIPESTLQVVIVVNFLYAIGIYVLLAMLEGHKLPEPTRNLTRRVNMLLLLTVLYGFAAMALFGANLTAAIASARNIAAPMLFLLIGLYASQVTQLTRYLRYLVWLGVAAIIFGFIEANTPGFWQGIGLQSLWEKKGIQVIPGLGLPKNFFASEQLVPGEFIRRMAGPFADPVNFGTFLFAVFVAAWYVRSRVGQVLAGVAVVLAVSKGALLGVLIFLAVWTTKVRSRFEAFLASVAVAVVGTYFFAFTQSSSTGSTAAHVGGLLAAFTEVVTHPLGRGFGGTGVLAGLFAEEGSESGSNILESGLGTIIGQLGVPGIILYAVFFGSILAAIHRIPGVRERVLGYSLTFAFIANMAFNEVALSPNSCAPYFIALGLLIGSSEWTTRAADRGESRTAEAVPA